jgi:hypothetical protein
LFQWERSSPHLRSLELRKSTRDLSDHHESPFRREKYRPENRKETIRNEKPAFQSYPIKIDTKILETQAYKLSFLRYSFKNFKSKTLEKCYRSVREVSDVDLCLVGPSPDLRDLELRPNFEGVEEELVLHHVATVAQAGRLKTSRQ